MLARKRQESCFCCHSINVCVQQCLVVVVEDTNSSSTRSRSRHLNEYIDTLYILTHLVAAAFFYYILFSLLVQFNGHAEHSTNMNKPHFCRLHTFIQCVVCNFCCRCSTNNKYVIFPMSFIYKQTHKLITEIICFCFALLRAFHQMQIWENNGLLCI